MIDRIEEGRMLKSRAWKLCKSILLLFVVLLPASLIIDSTAPRYAELIAGWSIITAIAYFGYRSGFFLSSIVRCTISLFTPKRG